MAWVPNLLKLLKQDELKLLTFRVIFRIVFGDCGALSDRELQAASQDFGTLLGGITFPLTRTDGIFAFTPFGKAMAARQRMKVLILTKVGNCRGNALAASGEIDKCTDHHRFWILKTSADGKFQK